MDIRATFTGLLRRKSAEAADAPTAAKIAKKKRGDQAAINQRLQKLDREWDAERCLATGAASLTLLGMLFGAAVNRKWFLLPAAVAGFLLQHSISGPREQVPLF